MEHLFADDEVQHGRLVQSGCDYIAFSIAVVASLTYQVCSAFKRGGKLLLSAKPRIQGFDHIGPNSRKASLPLVLRLVLERRSLLAFRGIPDGAREAVREIALRSPRPPGSPHGYKSQLTGPRFFSRPILCLPLSPSAHP